MCFCMHTITNQIENSCAYGKNRLLNETEVNSTYTHTHTHQLEIYYTTKKQQTESFSYIFHIVFFCFLEKWEQMAKNKNMDINWNLREKESETNTLQLNIVKLALWKKKLDGRRTHTNVEKCHNKWLLPWRKVVLFDNMLLLLLFFLYLFTGCVCHSTQQYIIIKYHWSSAHNSYHIFQVYDVNSV